MWAFRARPPLVRLISSVHAAPRLQCKSACAIKNHKSKIKNLSMAAGEGKVVGIDLGTTYCAIATLDDRGQPVTLPNRDGEMLTPSAVLLMDDGVAVVGQAALDYAQESPERVATLIKRRMGLDDYGRAVAGRHFRPETLSAIILRKLV